MIPNLEPVTEEILVYDNETAMNRRLFNILMIGAVAVFSLSCNQEEIAPDVPDTPAEGKLVRLTFGTADARTHVPYGKMRPAKEILFSIGTPTLTVW